MREALTEMEIPINERFSDWKKRRRCEKELAHLDKIYSVEIEKLKGEARESEIAAYMHECELPRAEIEHLNTKYMRAEARSLGIEVLEDELWWEEDYYSGGKYLSDVGKTRLAKLIRDEKWQRMERLLKVSGTLITAATGLLGTLIGFLSLWRR